MENIKVLIVEDQLLIAEDIAARLRKHGLEIFGICASGEEALSKLEERAPDLILMDIELAGAMDGISVAQVINLNYDIPVIYLSDFSDTKTFQRAKQTQPANYLTKPFNEDNLLRAIDIAFTNANQNERREKSVNKKSFVFLRAENQVYRKFMLHEILFLKAGRSYCQVVMAVKEYTLTNPMSHVQQQLNDKDFVKVHRSYVVNINQVTSVKGNVIVMGNKEVQMSPEHREEVLGLLNILK